MDDDIRNRFRGINNDVRPGPMRPMQPQPRGEVLPPPRPAHPAQPRPMVLQPPKPMSHMQPRPIPRPAAAAPHPAHLQHHSHQTQAAHHQPAQQTNRKSAKNHRLRNRFILISAVVLLAGAGGAGWKYTQSKAAVQIPASIVAKSDFPLLYPDKLPDRYKIDAYSFNSSQDVVLYSADKNGADKIAFSVQKRPPTFDFNAFYKQGMGNASTFDSPLGQAALGTTNGHPIGSLATDKSWILVSSISNNVQSSDIRLILNNLKIVSSK